MEELGSRSRGFNGFIISALSREEEEEDEDEWVREDVEDDEWLVMNIVFFFLSTTISGWGIDPH